MTPPPPNPSIPWERTLPKPAALLQNPRSDAFMPRRGSSLLDHHIAAAESEVCLDRIRRHTVPNPIDQPRPSTHNLTEPARLAPIFPAEEDVFAEFLIRKRTASLMADGSESGEQSPTNSSPSAAESTSHYCLCQRDPKIPRPRNAFILFRQHQQAAVVAQHPGLANPDISKIIGKQWRALPAKAKNEWKALAEEEKARHQQRYPEYRYQPRRNGRYSSQSSGSGPASAVCPKCGGKTMNPPSTPYTPFTPATPVPQPQLVQLHSVPAPGYSTAAQNGRQPLVQALVSPQSGRVRHYTEFLGRPQFDPRVRYVAAQAQPTSMVLDPPDPKRRRFNGHGVLLPFNSVGFREPTYQPSPPFPRPEAPRTNMVPNPRTATYGSISGSTGLPLQLQPLRNPHPEHGKRDPDLTLPPLKTATTSGPPTQTQTSSTPCSQQVSANVGVKSSLEAMIHSIPVLNKIKILSQISPPMSIRASRPSLSPGPKIRGAIIAIESLDPKLVSSMVSSLASQLESSIQRGTPQFAVRIFSGPNPYLYAQREGELTTENILQMIGEWHKISKEMLQYITTKPEMPGADRTNPLKRKTSSPADTMMCEAPGTSEILEKNSSFGPVDDTTQDHGRALHEQFNDNSQRDEMDLPPSPDSAVSPRTITQTAKLSLKSPDLRITQTHAQKSSAAGTGSSTLPELSSSTIATTRLPASSSTSTATIPIPIALIPAYQLTTADLAAIAMSITDSYSPLNHWQWLASLWRGCIGPDASVVVQFSRHPRHRPGQTGHDEQNGPLAARNNNEESSSQAEDENTTTAASGAEEMTPHPGGPPHQSNRKAPSTTESTITTTGGAPGSGSNNNTTTVDVRLNDAQQPACIVVNVNTTTTSDVNDHSPTTTCSSSQLQDFVSTSMMMSEGWEKAKRRVGFEIAEFLRK